MTTSTAGAADHKAAKKWAERIKGALPKETANLGAEKGAEAGKEK